MTQMPHHPRPDSDLSPDHPMSFEDFKQDWESSGGGDMLKVSPRDAYDAYLSGVSEKFQQLAMTCPLDEVLYYVDQVTKVMYMRRDNIDHLGYVRYVPHER